MALSIGTMELMEHVWFERYAYNQLFLMYGKLRGICNVGLLLGYSFLHEALEHLSLRDWHVPIDSAASGDEGAFQHFLSRGRMRAYGHSNPRRSTYPVGFDIYSRCAT